MILRPATPDDSHALAQFGQRTFVAKFGHLYGRDDLAVFLDEVHSPASVAREIASDGFVHRLAEDATGLVGYCKLIDPSPHAGYSDAARPVALGQLYTDPDRTGQGIGGALMEWALGEARMRGHDAIHLCVYNENAPAQRFYARYGFVKIADVDFIVGHQRDHEFLCELRLASNG